MSSEGILSSSLAGKNECELCGKALHIEKTHSDIKALFTERKRLNVIFARTRLRERISWCHIKHTPRVPLIKSLTENVKIKLKLSSHLRRSIFPKKLNNRPTLDARFHIKTQLRLPNIHD